MGRASAALLVIAGIIHLLPLQGVLGATVLAKLYGVVVTDPNTEILLRHRAILFALLGALLVLAAAHAPWRPLAYAAGLISAGSFLAVAGLVGGYNAALARVVTADVVALVCLLLGAALEWRLRWLL